MRENCANSVSFLKVESLNLLTDSNRLLREEKERLWKQVEELEERGQRLEAEITPLRESNRCVD